MTEESTPPPWSPRRPRSRPRPASAPLTFVVGPKVILGDRVRLISHVVVDGITSIGDGTVVYPFASIGHRPQDMKYKGEPDRLIIGREEPNPRICLDEPRAPRAAAW